MSAVPVIVTGGAGYVGSHACKALAAAGYLPVCVDDLSRGHDWAVKWGPLEKVSVADRDGLKAVFDTYRPAAVMHFAAYAYVGESTEDPDLYYRNNLSGTLNLLSVMAEVGCRRFVFSSTCAIYGLPETLPIPEDHACRPINPYGRTKYLIECALEDYDAAYGIRAACLRYFNAAGADPDNDVGEAHDPETHAIPLALEAAAQPNGTFRVNGTDYDTPDGTCIRDYIHVADLAAAHVLALKHLESADASVQLNLGTGSGVSVFQVLEAVRAVTGNELDVEHGPRRAGDPPMLVADTSRAKEVLGWQPEYPDIHTIVAHAWRWMNRNS